MNPIEIEKSILGAFMVDPKCVKLANKLIGYYWKEKRNHFVFEAILRLVKSGQSVNVLSVLDRMTIGNTINRVSRRYVTELTANVATTAHMDKMIDILLKSPDKGDLSDEWVDVKTERGVCSIHLTKEAAHFLNTADIDDIVLTIGSMFYRLGKTPSVGVCKKEDIILTKVLEQFWGKNSAANVCQSITLNEYQKKAAETCMETSNNNLYCLFGLAEETGEVMGKVAKAIRKGWVRSGEDNNLQRTLEDDDEYRKWRELLFKELGDVMWMVSQLARTMGWTLEGVCKDNLSKLADRQSRSVIDSEGDNR